MDERQPLVSGYHKNSEDAIGNIFDVFLWVLKQINFIVVSHLWISDLVQNKLSLPLPSQL